MKTTPITSIKIGDRHRKAFDEETLAELAESIFTKGLLHPIVLLQSKLNKVRKKPFTLVAGERRLRAIIQLITEGRPFACDGEMVKGGLIPYILITETDKILLRETELEENLIREDLTWPERTLAIHELHQLRLAKNPKQTDSDTARELAQVSTKDPEPAAGSSRISAKRKEVARANIVAPYLDDPAVSGAGSAAKAFAVVAAKIEADFMAELAERGETAPTEHVLIAGDLREEMKRLPDNYFTVIVADPPYGIGADEFGDVAELRHNYQDDAKTALSLVHFIAKEGERVTEDQAHMYIFCDVDLFIIFRDMINSETDWKCWRTPIIWDKQTGYAPQQSSGWQRTYEMVLFASKGGKPFGKAEKDIMQFSADRKKIHAAGKPFQLYAEFFKYSCLPGDFVLDPCCGAGTVFSAAICAGVVATGIEIDSEWLDHARLRMHQND